MGGQVLPSLQLLHHVCLSELQWAKLHVETSVLDLKNVLHFPVLDLQG